MVPAIGLLRRGETRELSHGPQSPAIHRLVDAARIRKLPGITQIPRWIEILQLIRTVERLNWHPADGGVLLFCDSHDLYLTELALRSGLFRPLVVIEIGAVVRL